MCVKDIGFYPVGEGLFVHSQKVGDVVMGEAWVRDEDGFIEIADIVAEECEFVREVLGGAEVGFEILGDLVDASIGSANDEAGVAVGSG